MIGRNVLRHLAAIAACMAVGGSAFAAADCSTQGASPEYCYHRVTNALLVEGHEFTVSTGWQLAIYLYGLPQNPSGSISAATAFAFDSLGNELPCGIYPAVSGTGWRYSTGGGVCSTNPATISVYGND
jgi:hypothetical protein